MLIDLWVGRLQRQREALAELACKPASAHACIAGSLGEGGEACASLLGMLELQMCASCIAGVLISFAG